MQAGAAGRERGRVRTRKRDSRRARLEPYLWVAPAVILFLIFTVAPTVVGLALSFVTWDGITAIQPAGLQNFVDAFHDGAFWQAVLHNVVYAVGTVVGKIVLALALALILNASVPARGFFRTALFMPVVLSFVIVGLIWGFVYDFNFGLINGFLGLVGLQGLQQDWLGSGATALAALIVVDIWKWFGFHMVIFLAGLQGIPTELYEAARIDGANKWQSFWGITLPLLKPVMAVNVLTATLGGFGVFDLVYIMTTGGPFNSTNVAALDIYTQAFQYNHFGYASALSFILFALIAVVSLALLRVLRTERYT